MKIPKWLRPEASSPRQEFQEIVDDAKAYLIAQTVEPLKGVGRMLAFGIAGAMVSGLGLILCLVGLLRVLQTETGGTFAGTWSFVPYLAVVFAGVLVAGMAVSIGLRRYRKQVNPS